MKNKTRLAWLKCTDESWSCTGFDCQIIYKNVFSLFVIYKLLMVSFVSEIGKKKFFFKESLFNFIKIIIS